MQQFWYIFQRCTRCWPPRSRLLKNSLVESEVPLELPTKRRLANWRKPMPRSNSLTDPWTHIRKMRHELAARLRTVKNAIMFKLSCEIMWQYLYFSVNLMNYSVSNSVQQDQNVHDIPRSSSVGLSINSENSGIRWYPPIPVWNVLLYVT